MKIHHKIMDETSGKMMEIEHLDPYMAELGHYKRLTYEEEQELASRIQDGDEEAFRILVERNLRFVVKLAAEQRRNAGLSLFELISAGNMGLMDAARKFMPGRGCRFSSFAKWYVNYAMHREMYKIGRALAIPLDWRHRDAASPCDENRFLSIGRAGDEDVRGVVAEPRDEMHGDPFAIRAFSDDVKRIRECLDAIPKREKTIVEGRFGLDNGVPKVFKEMAVEGCSRSRCHQLFDKAVATLRDMMAQD